LPIKWNTSPERIVAAGAAGLFRGVNKVMEKSRTKYCPKATGHLASTGVVDQPVIDGGTVRVTARYTADYAIYVHERNLRYRNGQWKYLSTPAYEDADSIRDEIRDAIQAEVGQ
jgi:hypothetical protein